MAFTKEQLIERCKSQADYAQAIIDLYPDDVGAAESRRIAEIALSALAGVEAEAAYFINRVKRSDAYGDDVELRTYCYELDALKSKDDFGSEVVPVYTAPQPLTTAERAELDNYRNPETADREMLKRLAVILSGSDLPGEIKALTVTAQSFVDRCKTLAKERAAMQPGAGLKDGWVAVPVEPTEDMIIEGFESKPDEFFSKSEEWEAYQEMSGCEQAAHRAKLCWAAMIAAVPRNSDN